MRSLPSELFDPRFYVFVSAVFLLHAMHFAGEATSPRAEMWLLGGVAWLVVAAAVRVWAPSRSGLGRR